MSDNIIREFKLTTLSLKNKISVFILTFLIVVIGFMSYTGMPKELFPEVVFPYIMVQTVYPGNNPSDIENLITRPIEKEIDGIKGIKKISSTSMQDVSLITIEFNFDRDLKSALQDIKDAVDKAKPDLPTDLKKDPVVQDIDISEFPFININISGDYSIDELKKFADDLSDKFKTIKQVSKVNIQGISDKEVKINVDNQKMESLKISFNDIKNAIKQENISMGGGQLKIGNIRRSIRILGEFKSADQLNNIIIKHEKGNIVYLKDIASVEFGFEDAKSISRLNTNPVLSLQLVKKSGENLLKASDQVYKIIDQIRKDKIVPDNLKIVETNDQSDIIKKQLNNLENSMIMSIIFVVAVLFFFLGTRNALIVGLAIPMSMFLSFMVLSAMGYKINMVVLFGLILALGMLVDNAIVVVENIYRFIQHGYKKTEAAKLAVGEVAIPIIASTATTLAAFLPLIFWDSIMGEFMKYMPITLIVVLTSSLFVALVITPVFSATYVKNSKIEKLNHKRAWRIAGILALISIPFYFTKIYALANIFMIGAIITTLNILLFNKIGNWFKNIFLSKLENAYLKILNFSIYGRRPYLIVTGAFLLLIATIFFLKARNPKVIFFPSGDPNYINIKAELPIGTDITATDIFMKKLYTDVTKIIKNDTGIIKSVVTNVGKGAKTNDFRSGSQQAQAYDGLITITFVDYAERNGINTSEIMKDLSNKLINRYPGVKLSLSKDKKGPPTGKEINIEISGQEFKKLLTISDSVQNLIDAAHIPGIEGLNLDLNVNKPEMIVHINRDAARRFGLSTVMIAQTLRTAIFGDEISDLKQGEDKYPIQLRLKKSQRYDIPTLMNQKLTFRNKRGKIMQIPISAVADFSYQNTYGAIKRIDLNRVVTIYSNVIEGYNANDINSKLKNLLSKHKDLFVNGYSYKFTGQQQEQADSMAFLGKAFAIAIALIFLILVTQFNSFIKPAIILSSVVLSTIGVFGGIATFNMDIIIVMTGVGIVSLAGVVVNNAIVLIDYIDLLKARRKKELNIPEEDFLPADEATKCIVQGGKTRLRPVLLTAITTILGLVPMAIGLNIDFISLLTDFDPKLSFGGDMVAIWSPISWTVIFGLTFATFLTLVIVPAIYRITTIIQIKINSIIKN